MEAQKLKCKICGSEDIKFDSVSGEYICQSCGAVVQQETIDISQEWRAFGSEQLERRARTGSPLSPIKHDKGLSTQIGKGLTELYKVPTEKRIQYYRISQWHKRLMRSKDRNLMFAMSELQRIASYLNLPKTIQERVATYYERLIEKSLIRGRSTEAILAALIYYVTREEGMPRTFDEIAEAAGVEKREIGRAYRFVARELGLRILPADPADYIARFVAILGLSEKVKNKALEILKKAEEAGVISGKGPTGVAAAIVYIASVLEGERRTQREIAEKCKLTEVTIRNRYKEIVEKLGLEQILTEKELELEKAEKKEEKKEEEKPREVKEEKPVKEKKKPKVKEKKKEKKKKIKAKKVTKNKKRK
ncbi:MAG: TFIIB-type zinc ribbon-containing protein [Candidatus Aenigmatarchaeota archaeon]